MPLDIAPCISRPRPRPTTKPSKDQKQEVLNMCAQKWFNESLGNQVNIEQNSQINENPTTNQDNERKAFIKTELQKIFNISSVENSAAQPDENIEQHIKILHQNRKLWKEDITKSMVIAAVILYLSVASNPENCFTKDQTGKITNKLNIVGFMQFLYDNLQENGADATELINIQNNIIGNGYLIDFELVPEFSLINCGGGYYIDISYYEKFSDLSQIDKRNIINPNNNITNQEIRKTFAEEPIIAAKKAANNFISAVINPKIENLSAKTISNEYKTLEDILKSKSPDLNKIYYLDNKFYIIEHNEDGSNKTIQLQLQEEVTYNSENKQFYKAGASLVKSVDNKDEPIKEEKLKEIFTIYQHKLIKDKQATITLMLLELFSIANMMQRNLTSYKMGPKTFQQLVDIVCEELEINDDKQKIHLINAINLATFHRNCGITYKRILKAPIVLIWYILPALSAASMFAAAITSFGALGPIPGSIALSGAGVEGGADFANYFKWAKKIHHFINCGDRLVSTTTTHDKTRKQLLKLLQLSEEDLKFYLNLLSTNQELKEIFSDKSTRANNSATDDLLQKRFRELKEKTKLTDDQRRAKNLKIAQETEQTVNLIVPELQEQQQNQQSEINEIKKTSTQQKTQIKVLEQKNSELQQQFEKSQKEQELLKQQLEESRKKQEELEREQEKIKERLKKLEKGRD